MIIPNLQPPFENLTSPNPNIVDYQHSEYQKTPHFDSQSSKTLTLDDRQSHETLAELNLNPHRFARADENPRVSLLPASQDASSFRGPNWKKLRPKRTAQEIMSQEKLRDLVETLKPVPFVPSVSLDFNRHKSLLRRLGLWDFVHIEFDGSIRSDLLAQLIANYTPNLRSAYVNGIKIMVNRDDLGRALKLPTKRTAVSTDNVMETLDLAESIAFIEKLVSIWMLLHEDAYIVPPEVLACTKLIKEGHLEKIDWAGLIWNMVEKELKASHLENCYYASHLQRLIETQHEELLRNHKVDIEVRDEEDEEEEEEEEEEEVFEEHNIELSLGQDNVEKIEVEKEQIGAKHNIVDFEEFKEEEPGHRPILQGCNVGDLESLEEEEEEEKAEDVHEDECNPLVGMSSGSLIQAMQADPMPYSSGIELHTNSVGDFLSSGEHAQIVSGVSHFGNGPKRYIDQDNHNLHQSQAGCNKRLRSDSLWDAKPVEFNMCMEHVEHWMGQARVMYATKKDACKESSMNQQLFYNELQKRDSMIEHLQKARLEESQKRQIEVYRLERELFMMEKLLVGYRKALKETQKAFLEYRDRCPQANEPLYKDVPGSGGLVLSDGIEKGRFEVRRTKNEAFGY